MRGLRERLSGSSPPSGGPVDRVVVELAGFVDARGWADRHAQGLVADASPYGLHLLRDHGFDVWIRGTDTARWRQRLDGFVLHHSGMAITQTCLPRYRSPFRPDVLLAWSERSAAPAVARERLSGRRTPVVGGVIWATDAQHRPAALRVGLIGCARLFVLSTGQIGPLRDWLGADAPPIDHLPFGIDTDFFAATAEERAAAEERRVARTSDTDTPLRVITVGNDVHRDYETLLGGLRLARGQGNLTLDILAGRSFPELPEWATAQSVPIAALRTRLARSDVMIVATTHNLHASGITAVLEAMSVGLPVIVTDTPGMSDYVRHERNALLVPPSSPEAIRAAVGRLRSDRDLARELSEQAVVDVRAQADVAVMQDRLAEILRRAIRR